MYVEVLAFCLWTSTNVIFLPSAPFSESMSIHNFGLVFFQPHNLPLLGRRRKRMTLIKKYAQRQEKKSHEISKPTKLFLHEFPVIDMKNVLKPF